ncbi:MAG: helix-turn-helix domain-containing protein [Planctomycetes bacterium]|nr:helix-turn-helix domain-containing protein [Planctomycetota bacterium]
MLTMRDHRLLERLGDRVQRRRHERDLGLAELAQHAGLSRRYLTEVEAGRANPSLLKLARLAEALNWPLARLCDLAAARPATGRVALVGLRGAGKSTVGRRLALALELPFVEIDRLVAERSGMELASIFSLHGEGYYRRLHREALEHALATMGTCILAPGGSVVEDDETWGRLLATCRVVWLRARPEDHWDRVVNQGDTRPMQSHPRAMDELREILARRSERYAEAPLAIETSGRSIDGIVEDLSNRLAAEG